MQLHAPDITSNFPRSILIRMPETPQTFVPSPPMKTSQKILRVVFSTLKVASAFGIYGGIVGAAFGLSMGRVFDTTSLISRVSYGALFGACVSGGLAGTATALANLREQDTSPSDSYRRDGKAV